MSTDERPNTALGRGPECTALALRKREAKRRSTDDMGVCPAMAAAIGAVLPTRWWWDLDEPLLLTNKIVRDGPEYRYVLAAPRQYVDALLARLGEPDERAAMLLRTGQLGELLVHATGLEPAQREVLEDGCSEIIARIMLALSMDPIARRSADRPPAAP